MANDYMNQLFNNANFVKMYKMAERFTGPFAGELVNRSSFKQDLSKLHKVVVLDNACGTGIVSTKVMAMVNDSTAHKVELTCADNADAMVNAMKSQIETSGWQNAKAVKADAQDTKLPSSHFTHIFFSFGPMLIPNPGSSLKECHRMLTPGGVLGINTWECVGWYQDFHDALAENPEFPYLPNEEVFVQGLAKTKERWDRPNFVREHLEAHGFDDFEVEAVPHQTSMTVDEAVELVSQAMGIIYTNFWSEEQRNNATLKEQAAKAVEKLIREKYTSGEVTWNWIAICGLCRKPN